MDKNVFFLTLFLFCCSLANGQDDVLNDFTDYTDTALNMNIEMIAVRGGAFTMGCTEEQGNDCFDSEKPARQVAVSDFYIGKYEITQAQWKAVMGTTVQQQRDMTHPDATIQGEGDHYPMYYVNWNEVQEFIRRLNEATGKNYRLPAEAEWEFAARGGNSSRGFKYSGSHTVDEVAWYSENSNSSSHPVGAKAPNELGIYDMSGNLSEYCSDWYDKDGSDPQVPASGSSRVSRGGNWYADEKGVRVSYGNSCEPLQRYANIGFRLVCSLKNDTVGLTTNAQYAEGIINEAISIRKTKNYSAAIALLENNMEWLIKSDGVISTYLYLGILYSDVNNYMQAERYYLEFINSIEIRLGKESPGYAAALHILGEFYHYKPRDFVKAEQYYLEEIRMHENISGKESGIYDELLYNLGIFYQVLIFDYAKAEKIWLELLEVRENVKGKTHPDYSVTLYYLFSLYLENGDFAQAEKLLLEAKDMYEKVFGKEHENYATALNNSGELYIRLGDYEQAEKYYLEALAIREKVFGKNHRVYAMTLEQLGQLYHIMEDYIQAEKYYLEAINIRKIDIENIFYKIDFVSSLNNIVKLYLQLGKYVQAFDYYIEAMKNTGALKNRIYADVEDNAGMINCNYFEKHEEAEKHYMEAKNIRESIFGKDHPDYAVSLRNLLFFYQQIKAYDKALAINKETSELTTQFVDINFAFLSEQQRSLYWKSQEDNIIVSYSLSQFYPEPSVNGLNYNNTLFSKGLLLRTSNDIRDAVFLSGDSSLIQHFEQLGQLRRLIGNLQQKEDNPDERFAMIQARADSLEKAITQSSQPYRDLKANLSMTWQDVQKQLKPDEAAIEFVDFRLYDKKWTDTTIYAALVLRPGMETPAWIPLCEQKQLESLLRTTVQSTQMQTENLYVDKGEKLYELIWQNLEKELTDVYTIYYSPAGLLYKIAFNALPTNEENVILSDKYNLQLVSSTREIARLKQEKASTFVRDSTVVYGGLTYDRRQLSQAAAEKRIVQPNEQPSDADDRFVDRFRKRSAELPPADLRAGFSEWQHLPGTKRETEEIVKLLTEKRVPYQYYIEDQGTEESFKDLSGTDTKVIFVGTHGFFLADLENKVVENIVQRLGGGKDKPFENPMLRSGLIMSGANEQWLAKEYLMDDDREDGILTADEISRLNLIKTNLVVLSACETGLGDVKNSEGVFGLQRAFKLAGVESLIMSLWQVPDIATADLMTTFYQLWLSGQTKQSAFRAAQQKVREKYQSPYYWAAFVMMD